jgi:single-strand DNA-binding protein
MASVNKVILIGNLTRDPEVRYTPKGSAVTDLGLAVNRRYRMDNGEEREEVCFVDITFWGKQAETLGKWMKKGRPIYVEGRLQLDSWDDKTSGKKMSKLRVVGEHFQFLGGGRGDAEGGGAEEGGGESSGGGGGERSSPSRGSAGGSQQHSAGNSGGAAGGGGEEFPPGLDDDEIPF